MAGAVESRSEGAEKPEDIRVRVALDGCRRVRGQPNSNGSGARWPYPRGRCTDRFRGSIRTVERFHIGECAPPALVLAPNLAEVGDEERLLSIRLAFAPRVVGIDDAIVHMEVGMPIKKWWKARNRDIDGRLVVDSSDRGCGSTRRQIVEIELDRRENVELSHSCN